MSTRATVPALACLCLVGTPAMAGSHSWDVNEVFSNADGTIQYIELLECCGFMMEINLGGLSVTSDATGNSFTFPANLVGPTSDRSLLLATAGFAALPGAPTPDYIIQDGFFSTTADTIRYYNYDDVSFTAGQLPLDGCQALVRDVGSLVPGVNCPENYAGVGGTVFADPADTNGDLSVNVLDLLDLLGCFGQPGTGLCAEEDINGDGTVNVLDLLDLLGAFGSSCPP